MQSSDDEIVHFADRLQEYNISQGGCEILCDISTPYPRPFVPKLARKSILDSFYNISHPGIKSIKNQKLLKARYFWPDMDKSIRQWCTECMSCQKTKKTFIDCEQLPIILKVTDLLSEPIEPLNCDHV